MKAVVSVIGKDMVGILARVSGACSSVNANVAEVTQSVLKGFFCMIMVIETDDMSCDIPELEAMIRESVPDMQVHVMHEDIFNSMHRI